MLIITNVGFKNNSIKLFLLKNIKFVQRAFYGNPSREPLPGFAPSVTFRSVCATAY
jgi:hypothetical protein